MATYSKLVVDLEPQMYKDICNLAHKRKTSRAGIIRGLIAGHLAELEAEPMTKTFIAPLRKTARVRTKK